MLSPTRPTLLNILRVLGRNDILTCLGVVHDRLGVWGNFIEKPVEGASGDKGVDIANVEKMLTANRDSGSAIAG